MLIIRGRVFDKDNPTVKILDSDSSEEEVTVFKEAWTRYFKGLMLLEFCDDATGMLTIKILRERFGIDVCNYNLVMRVDKQIPKNNAPLQNTLYLFMQLISLLEPPVNQNQYDYTLERWDKGKIVIRWVET